MADDLEPYNLPLQAGFRSRSFRKSARLGTRHILAQLPPEAHPKKNSVWIYPCAGKPRRPRGRPSTWQVKAYLCLSPRSYWPVISKLIAQLRPGKTHWKFYLYERGYERPDKIVFYAASPRKLRRLIARLRRAATGCGFHALRHAALPFEFGFEKSRRRGIYIGCDPMFLKTSWRLYRTLCWAWTKVNESYLKNLPEGREGWFQKMNLSLVHEGPASLDPDPSDIPYIRRYWRVVNKAA